MSEYGEHTSFNELPVVGRLVRDFDKNVGEKGLQGAMKDVIKRTGSKLEVQRMEGETERILAKKPVLLIGNHPYDAEMIPLIAVLPPRDDLWTIGSADFMTVGPNLSKHLIPVHIGERVKESQKLSVKLGGRFKVGPEIPTRERWRRNRESIDRASRRIREGGMVILFPEGFLGKGGRWFSGIGHLLKKVGSDTDAFLVMAYIEGTSNFDPLRIVPGIRKVLPTLKVTFSKPEEVNEILGESTNPKKITKALQDEYRGWVKTL